MVGFVTNKKRFVSWSLYLLLGCVIGVTIFCFGYFWNKRMIDSEPLLVSNAKCGEFHPNIRSIKLEKNSELNEQSWHWNYNFIADNQTGRIEMRCPTLSEDLNFELSGVPVGRTNTPYDKSYDNHVVVSTYNLLDCHNNYLYTIKIIDADDSNICFESTQCFVTKNNNVLYYINTTSDKSRIILSVFNQTAQVIWIPVANFDHYNNSLGIEEWKINIVDPTNHPVDPLLVIAIASKQSFSINSSYKKNL